MKSLEDCVGFDSVLATRKVDDLAYLQIIPTHSWISGLDGGNRCLISISNDPECVARFDRDLIGICCDRATRDDQEPTYS